MIINALVISLTPPGAPRQDTSTNTGSEGTASHVLLPFINLTLEKVKVKIIYVEKKIYQLDWEWKWQSTEIDD